MNRLAFFLAVTVVGLAGATGDTVYDQPWEGGNATFLSTLVGGQLAVADKFTLGAETTITSFSWVGLSVDGPADLSGIEFDVKIYADSFGQIIGPPLLCLGIGGTGGTAPTPVGLHPNDHIIFEQTVTLTNPWVLDAGDYWLHVGGAPLPVGGSNWHWIVGAGGDGFYRTSANGGTWSLATPGDMAFSIQGDFSPEPDPCLAADINGSGEVNVIDLLRLLICFGLPAAPECVAEDINGDGTVDVLDLIDLLLAFGTSCP